MKERKGVKNCKYKSLAESDVNKGLGGELGGGERKGGRDRQERDLSREGEKERNVNWQW